MRVAAVGVGGAGGRIVDQLWRDNDRRPTTYLGGACVVDTDTGALRDLDALPRERRHAFGLFESEGAGTDGDRSTGTAAIEDDSLEVRRAIDPLVTSDIDAVVLVAGVAGGTGGGAVAHIATRLSEIYTQPVYCVSVLPAGWDEDAATNTMATLDELETAVDGQLFFDNEAWLGSEQTVEAAADTLNDTLVTRLGALFAAGEVTAAESVGQSVVDASEIHNTLSGAGAATLGYASQDISMDDPDETMFDSLRDRITATATDDVDEAAARTAIETAVRRALQETLTAECPRDAADTALTVFAGPPAWLLGDAIADGRQWLSEELQSSEIRTGDVPTPQRQMLSVLVLLSNVTDVPRLEELESLANEG